jgi:hypothetical protein
MKRTALVLTVLALSACQAPMPTQSGMPTQSPRSTTTSAPSTLLVDLGDGIQLSVVGTDTATTSQDPTCAAAVHGLRTADGAFQALLITPGCVGTDNTPENGNHGFYPAPPATARVDKVSTPVGDATLFSNQYSECTSSCYMGTDEVALVMVGDRVVQVIAVTAPASGTMERDRAGLVAVLQGLRRA